MKLLVKTCCKITYHVLNKRFMTKEILPCMAINTNFGEIRCPPPLPPEKIDGNVNWTRVYVDTHDDRFSQTGAVIWADLFSLTSEVEFPDNTNSFLLHNTLLTLLFVRLFPTSCFDNDFAVESLPRLFSTFEAPCFAVFPVGLKNDRISCRKIYNYNWNTG